MCKLKYLPLIIIASLTLFGCRKKAEITLENAYGDFHTARPVFRWTTDKEGDFLFRLRLYDASRNYEKIDEVTTGEYEYQFDYPLKEGSYQLGLAIIEPEEYTNKSWTKKPFGVIPKAVPEIMYTAGREYYNTIGITVGWKNVTDTDRYEVQMKSLENGELYTLYSSSSRGFPFNPLPFESISRGEYEMKVRALYPDQITGEWSDPYILTLLEPGDLLLSETIEPSYKILEIGKEEIKMQLCPGGYSASPSYQILDYVPPFWFTVENISYETWLTVASWAEREKDYRFANTGYPGKKGVEGINWRDTIVWSNALHEFLSEQNPFGNGIGTPYTMIGEGYTFEDSNYSECDLAELQENDAYRLPEYPDFLILRKFLESTSPSENQDLLPPLFYTRGWDQSKEQIPVETGFRLIQNAE